MARKFTVGTSENDLPPHYFFGRAAKGFKGKHFLEQGLVVAVEAAKIRLSELLNIQLRHLPNPTVSRFNRFRGAGIGFNIIQNVTELSKISINALMTRAFTEVVPLAKRESDSAFKGSLSGGNQSPLTLAGKRAPVTSSYRFEVFRSDVGVGIRPTGRGGVKNVSKVSALNFGLRRSLTDFQDESDIGED